MITIPKAPLTGLATAAVLVAAITLFAVTYAEANTYAPLRDRSMAASGADSVDTIPLAGIQSLTVIEDFNSDPSLRWTPISANEATIDWHWRSNVSQHCFNPPYTSSSYPYAATGKLWMGRYSLTDNTQDPGPKCNYGGIGLPQTPPFTRSVSLNTGFLVPAQGVHSWLGFYSYEHTEKSGAPSATTDACRYTPACDRDIRRVYVKRASDTGWGQPVWDTMRDPAVEQQWHFVSISLDPWRAGTIQVRFEFNDGPDGYLNDWPGWFVDHIVVFDTSYDVRLPVVMKSYIP